MLQEKDGCSPESFLENQTAEGAEQLRTERSLRQGQIRCDSEKPTDAWKGERASPETEAISAKNIRLRAKL